MSRWDAIKKTSPKLTDLPEPIDTTEDAPLSSLVIKEVLIQSLHDVAIKNGVYTDRGRAESLRELLYDWCTKRKVYLLSSINMMAEVTESIFQSGVMVDLVLDLKAILFTRLMLSESEKKVMISRLALALGIQTDSELSLVPQQYSDVLADQEKVKDLLLANDFLLPLVLIATLLNLSEVDRILGVKR